MKVIAFAGLARGGKTTAADALEKWCHEHDMNPIRCSFADPIKKAAKRLGISKENNPDLYRKTLQRWGESRRDPEFRPGKTGPNYWVERVLKQILTHQYEERQLYRKLIDFDSEVTFKESVLIFDDLRYDNELALINTYGGLTIFVDGAGIVKDFCAQWRQHPSETMAMAYTMGLLPDSIFDFYIVNNASKEKFEKLVEQLAPAWMDVETLL